MRGVFGGLDEAFDLGKQRVHASGIARLRPRVRNVMGIWTRQELELVDSTDELLVSSYRRDGTLRPYVTIWTVRLGGDVYVRSAYGPENGWFRRAKASGRGRVRVGDVERDVRFEIPEDDDVHSALDDVYRAKYGRYDKRIVDTVVGPTLVEATLRAVPEG
jgi:hypothetical protein